jgi:hypothetical protein
MNQSKPPTFSVRYDQSDIKYVTQFLVSPGREEVLLDLSAGLLNDGSEPQTLPIQTRIAMPWSAVERLARVLNQVVEAKQQPATKSPEDSKAPHIPKASLPSIQSTTLS